MLSRMKRVTFLWGALLFIVTIAMLYTMLDTMNSNPHNSKLDASLDVLESKVTKLEKDIKTNNEFIKVIRAEMGDVLGGVDVNTQKKDEKEKPKDVDVFKIPDARKVETYEPQVLLPGVQNKDFCSWVDEAESHADINTHALLETLPFDNPDGGVWKQGWDVRYSPDRWSNNRKLHIYVVPHTHCDPGWIKTFDQYYRTETKLILDSFVPKLEENSKYRFMFSEMSYFSVWWSDQTQEMKNRVKKLIANGQFELSTGGWVMTDEANAHYFAMLDQLIEGNQWLNNTLGYIPQSGWSIDPFGYSSTMAYLLKRSGFKSMLIQRVHYSIKKYLARERNLEFMWRQHWDSREATDMFTHLMPFYSYDVPHTCGPEPAICCQFDFKRLPGSNVRCPWRKEPQSITPINVKERSELLLDQWKKKATLYKTDVLLIPLGDDFRYSAKKEFDAQFSNYEQIFKYLEEHPELGAQAQFGTLSDYFNGLYRLTDTVPGQSPMGMPSLSGDFFSYADRDDHYWSGYYTSRPFQKNLDRVLEHNLRSAEIIFSLALTQARKMSLANFPSKTFMQQLSQARRALGVFQHHDAITGTAKDFVVVDYGKMLLQGLQNCKSIMAECSTFLLANTKTEYAFSASKPVLSSDEIRNSHDSLPFRPVLVLSTEIKSVVLYNSLAQARLEQVKVMVSWPYLEVKDHEGQVIHSQVEPYWLEGGTIAKDKFKVTFVANLKGLSLSRYTIRRTEYGQDTKNHLVTVTIKGPAAREVDGGPFKVKTAMSSSDFDVETKFLRAIFSPYGLLKSVTVLSSGTTFKTEMSLIQYGTKMAKERSGAYLFLPDGDAKPLLTQQPSLIRILSGSLGSEVYMKSDLVEQTTRLHNCHGADGLSVDVYNLVNIQRTHNKEIGMRIETDISNSDRIFYSDVNGFQMQRRKYHQKLTLQGNVYPMPTMAYLQDTKKRFTVVSSQSSGVANLVAGVIDVMLDRRLNQDDNRGLGQGVLDNRVTPSRYRLVLEERTGTFKNPNPESSFPTVLAQTASLQLIHPIVAMPQSTMGKEMTLKDSQLLLQHSLPCDVHMLNLRALKNSDDDVELNFVPKESSLLLLRYLPTDCSFAAPSLACPRMDSPFKLSDLFANAVVKTSKLTSLTMSKVEAELDPNSPIELSPMEIVAVQVEIK